MRAFCWTLAASAAILTIITGLGRDFVCFHAAAQLALAGRPEAAFDLASNNMGAAILPWFYPPTFLLVIAPFGLLPQIPALVAFELASAAALAPVARRILPDRSAWLVALATPAGVINALTGQNAFLTAALAGGALMCLDARPLVAGILVGLLAIKPHFAMMLLLALIAGRHWRALASAVVTGALFNIISLGVFGWQTMIIFIAHLGSAISVMEGRGVALTASPYGLATSLGATYRVAMAWQGAAAVLAALCVYWTWRQAGNAPFKVKAAVVLVASLFVSPHVFDYDLVWAALAVGWLAALGAKVGFRYSERAILSLAWAAPALTPWVYIATGIQVTFLVLLLLLAVAVARAPPTSFARAQPTPYRSTGVAASRDRVAVGRIRRTRGTRPDSSRGSWTYARNL